MNYVKIPFAFFLILCSGLLKSQNSVEYTSPAFSYDGKFMAFAANRNEQFDLFLLDMESKKVTQLTSDESNDWYPEWINDSIIYFQSLRNGNRFLYSINRNTGQTDILVKENVNQVLHYGNSDMIFYITYKTKLAPDNKYYPIMETFEIVKFMPGTNDRYLLTENNYMDDAPHLNPSKPLIVYQSGKNGNIDIYTMDLEGSNIVQLTDHPGFDGIPVWNPSGDKIAFTRKTDEIYDVWIMNSDGSNQITLTDNESMDLYSAWTPDGKKLAFSSWRSGNQQIYLMNLETGGEVECLTCNLQLPEDRTRKTDN